MGITLDNANELIRTLLRTIDKKIEYEVAEHSCASLTDAASAPRILYG